MVYNTHGAQYTWEPESELKQNHLATVTGICSIHHLIKDYNIINNYKEVTSRSKKILKLGNIVIL